MGNDAGLSHYKGWDNLLLGKNSASSANQTNNLTIQGSSSIGANSLVDASNKVRIGSATVTKIEGQVAWSIASDARFKENVSQNVPGIDFINGLNPVTYNFDTRMFQEHIIQSFPDSVKTTFLEQEFDESSSITHTGFLAQEVEQVCNQLGYDFSGLNKPDSSNPASYYTVSYSQFVVPLVKAVQEQQDLIEAQETEIEILQQKSDEKDAMLQDLIQRIETLERE